MRDNTLHDLHQQAIKILSVLEATAVAIDQPDADPANYTGALEIAIDSMHSHIEGLDEARCVQPLTPIGLHDPQIPPLADR